jgi:hypothetical protein
MKYVFPGWPRWWKNTFSELLFAGCLPVVLIIPLGPSREGNNYKSKAGSREFGKWGIGTAVTMNSRKIAKMFGISLMYGLISFTSTHLNTDITIISKHHFSSVHTRRTRKPWWFPEVSHHVGFLLSPSSNTVCSVHSTTQISRRTSPNSTRPCSTTKSTWWYSDEIHNSQCWTSRTKLEYKQYNYQYASGGDSTTYRCNDRRKDIGTVHTSW